MNGNNETNVKNSGEISMSIYNEDSSEISIANSASKVGVWVPRSITVPVPEFVYVNASQMELPADSWFIPNSIQVKWVNVSVFVQIKYENSSAGYIVLVKFGLTPRFNATFKDIDDYAILCPLG